jgi:hypothetical protein
MIEIYKKSWRCIVANVWQYLLISILLELPPLFLNDRVATSLTILPLILFAYSLHRYFLFDESLSLHKSANPHPVQPYKTGRFVLVSLLVMGVPIMLAIVAIVKLFPVSWLSNPNDIFAAVLLTLLPLYLLSFGFFGTALPAAVARNESGYSLAKGYRHGPRIMGRLLLGPAPVVLILLAAMIGIFVAFNVAFGQLSPTATFIFGVIARINGMVGTTMAVAILCDTYRQIVPEPPPAEPGKWKYSLA